jgi:hypothetical protein
MPGSDSDVVIDVAGDAAVTYSSGNTSINSLQSQEGLSLVGGILDVMSTVQVGNT